MATSATTAARELVPLLTALRDETERERGLPAQIVERLVDTRLSRIAVAQQYDGLELPVSEALEVYEVLAAAEASVAWIVWNNSLPCFLSRFLGAATRAELFADRRWLYANSTRPTGKAVADGDGYRVSGRWSLVSGCELAEWVALACIVHDGNGPRMQAPGVPEQRLAVLRRGSFEILDTWHVGGLRGTAMTWSSPTCAFRTHGRSRRWTTRRSIARSGESRSSARWPRDSHRKRSAWRRWRCAR
jgi:alkylation response protein AidB-like acyl-CoA dehydrogenase